MIFFMGGPNSIFFGASRHISDFWRFTPKPEFKKKFALLTEIFKNYLIRF